MKSNLFLFTGFGFLGLNLAKYFKYKNFNISLIGKKKKYPFNIRFKTKHINLIYSDIFNLKKINDLKIENSIIVLTTLNNNNKDFFVKFKRFINLLVKKKPRKIILISSVGVYGNYSSKMFPIIPDGEETVTHNTLGKEKISPQKIFEKILEIIN